MIQELRYLWCCRCRDNLPMRSDVYNNLEETGEVFYCPKGHVLDISRLNVVQRLRSSERSLVDALGEKDTLWRQLSASRGVQTRFKNRLLRKCCPYCNKAVSNLFQHVVEKHDKK